VDHPPIQSVAEFELKTSESEGWIVQPSIAYLISPRATLVELAEPLGALWQLARVTSRVVTSCQALHPRATRFPCPTTSNKPASSKSRIGIPGVHNSGCSASAAMLVSFSNFSRPICFRRFRPSYDTMNDGSIEARGRI